MMDIPAVVLAGGRSTRMGADKAFVTLGGQPLVAHVAARLGAQTGPLAINSNARAARFADLGLPVLADGVAGWPGPLAGVLAAMDWAASLGAARVVTVAVDLPFFPPDLVARLAEAPGGAMAASGGRVHPVCAFWPVEWRAALRAALAEGERRVRVFAEARGAIRVEWEAGAADPFQNVNTPDDVFEALRRLT